MDLLEAIQNRHAVRNYLDTPLNAETIAALRAEIDACNAESGLKIQLAIDEPKAFDCFVSRYGHFSGVRNYLSLIGERSEELPELIGYYGQRIVLAATRLGLDSCWVATTFSKRKSTGKVSRGEKLGCVIALGYGETHGKAHKSKPMEGLYTLAEEGEMPEWFRRGMEAAMLAPTAVNQQQFLITYYDDDTVQIDAIGGMYSRVDLGIAKYHFEIGAGIHNFTWE